MAGSIRSGVTDYKDVSDQSSPDEHVSSILICHKAPVIERFHMTSRRPYWCSGKTMKLRHVGVPNKSCGS